MANTETVTLWQIGKERSKSEIEQKEGTWEQERSYTVGMDEDSIEHPNLPKLISVADADNTVFACKSFKIYFTLDRTYEQDILTLRYGYFGEEENRIFLDGQLLFKNFGISSTEIQHNRIPFPLMEAGEHILKIEIIDKRQGYHTISYLKLEALEGELESTTTTVSSRSAVIQLTG